MEQPAQDVSLQENTIDDNQSTSKDPSSGEEEMSSEFKSNPSQAVDSVAESKDGESSVDGATILPLASELCSADQELKATTGSPSHRDSPDEYLEKTKHDSSYPERSDECRKSHSLTVSRKRERAEPIDMFESEGRDDESNESGDESEYGIL